MNETLLVDILSFHRHFIDYSNLYNFKSIEDKVDFFINAALKANYKKENLIFILDSLVKDIDLIDLYFKKIENRIKEKRSLTYYGHHLLLGELLIKKSMQVKYFGGDDFETSVIKYKKPNQKIVSCNSNFYFKVYNKFYDDETLIYTFRYSNFELIIEENISFKEQSDCILMLKDINTFNKIANIKEYNNTTKEDKKSSCIIGNYQTIMDRLLLSNGKLRKIYVYKNDVLILTFLEKFIKSFVSYFNNKGSLTFNLISYFKTINGKLSVNEKTFSVLSYDLSNINEKTMYFLINKTPQFMFDYYKDDMKKFNKKQLFEFKALVCEIYSYYYGISFYDLFKKYNIQ